MTIANAKKNIAQAIKEEDKDMSKWYVERKLKSEFSTKQEIAGSGGFASAVTVEFI